MGKWLVAALLVLTVAVQVDATFASSDGFSGRNVDCTVCHAPAAPAATAILEGVPTTWRPGETYALRAAVDGGPLALPAPAPQGGFELEVEAGRVAPGAGMAGLLRSPEPTIITYQPEGTLQREWDLQWTAPGPHRPPEAVTLWLAVVAANGNHVIATNTSDGGEQGDAVDTLQVTVPPAPDVVAAWEALPLAPPIVDRIETTAEGIRIIGHHSDDNATHLAFRIGGGPWDNVPAAPDWRLVVTGTASEVELRSEGTGRVSRAIAPAAPQDTPAIGLLPLMLLLAALSGRTPTDCEASCRQRGSGKP